MTTIDEKYVVFKREEFLEWTSNTTTPPPVLSDAVVIRTKDVFAAPALEMYANGILVAIHTARTSYTELPSRIERLQAIADYFHSRATEAWERGDKVLPD